MKNSIQISLFLNEETYYKVNDLSYELSKEIEELGEPLMLPENKNFPQEANAPILLFIGNKDLQFISNFYTITITIAGKLIDKINDYVDLFMKVLAKFNVSAYRLGYVVNMQYDCSKIDSFKEKYVKSDDIIRSEDFELSWLSIININETDVNCWHRYYTNKQLNDKLNILFDINTKPTDKLDIDERFMLDFIEGSNNYINGLDI